MANTTMGKLKGAVAIITVKDDPSLDGLRGDVYVISSEHGQYSVKLRGTLTENTMPCFSPNKIS
jgi:hypothetical protein